MKKCVVTGGSGFVGSNLTRRLLNEGYEVNLIVKAGVGIEAIEDIKNELNIYFYDGDIFGLIKFFKNIGKVDIVFHLASLVLTNHRAEDIDGLLGSNIIFGTHLLEAMNSCGCRRIVNTGTYWQHYNNEEYNPVDLYAATKEAFEKIVEYYVNVKDFQAITLELFDNYGPGDPRKKVMNLLKECVQNGKRLDMSPGEQLIDLLYIDDLIEGYIIANNLIEGSQGHLKYVLSAKERITLRDLVGEVEKVVNKKLDINFGGRPYKDREIMLPWNKGEKLPNWEQTIDLCEGIKRIIGV